MSASSAGTRFVANATNTPNFASIAEMLTNGSTTDPVFVETGVSNVGIAGGLHPESYWASTNGGPADFSGCTLTHIDLVINNAIFSTPGVDPDNDGI